MILLDANILVYAANASSPFHNACKAVRDQGLDKILELCVTPQVLSEFFAIITDKKRVAKPITPKQATQEVENYLNADGITKIYPIPGVVEKTLSLLKSHRVKSAEIFDL